MGFSFKKWVLEKLGAGSEIVSSEQMTSDDFFGLSAELHIREIAFYSCINLIANAIGKCEFKTFASGVEAVGPEYYLLNVSPNKNQSSSVFLHKLVTKLYRNNEALVIETIEGELLVADSFSRKAYAVYDDVFTNVTVGDFSFNRPFTQSEVLYFRLGEKDMRRVVNGLYSTYRELIEYGMKSYRKSRGMKGTLNISAMAMSDPKFKERYENLKNSSFKTFAEAENSILPLYEGYAFMDIGSKTYSNEGTRDIRAMIDDVSDFTARAFGVPPALLSGEVQGISDALDQFLTFCIDPLCDMIEEELNRKRNGEKGYLAGNYIKIDTKRIKHVDLLSVASAIDKLIASGAFCINDIRKVVGESPINEEWANKHFITKNYSTVQDLLAALGIENKD